MKKTLLPGKVIAPLLMLLLFGSVVKATNYYTLTNGSPSNTLLWWTGTNGTGSHPANFNNAADVFTIQNNNSMTTSSAWTVAGSLILNSGCRLTTANNRGTITLGSLTINSGSAVTINRPLRVSGATNITGTITFGSTSGTSRTIVFTGAVTLNSGAIWTEPASGNGANNTYNFSNNFTNNATTFTAVGTGVHTFSGTGMTMSGSTSTAIPNVTITGTRTNSGTLTVLTALAGAGILINTATGILNYGGNGAIVPTLTANAVGNKVNYTGAGQTAKVTTYHNLTLSGSGVKTFATTPIVNGTLSLEGTASITVTGGGVITYATTATLQYNKPAAYIATTEEWITPFTATGGVIITNTGTITAPAGRTIGNGSSLNLQNGILAAGTNITMSSTSTINRIEGSMTGTLLGTGIYNVNYSGNSKSTGPELGGSGLYNVAVNLTSAATTLTSSGSAFTAHNNLTVTQGNLVLAASDANYTVTNDLIVSANGTLTHSVNWDIAGKLLRIDGNISIDGKFVYTVRSHVQMGGANKTIRTGPAPSSLSILTLVHTSGTISASGLVTVDDNFWASFNAAGGAFATSGYTVFAKGALLINGGILNINGGTLNVTAGLYSGFQNLSGSVTFSSGTLNSDFINIGDGIHTGTFSQSGGIVNITGSLLINPSCSYTCSNSPTVNIGGNLVNNGTYTKSTETFTFSGTTPVTISGSSNTDINNLSINNTGGVTTQLGLLTTNNFTVTSGKFTVDPQKSVTVNGALILNDSIILESTSAGTASLVTKGMVTGSKARVERYINGASWAWHFLSSPVAAQSITGSFTPSGTGLGYDFYTWYEPQLLWVNVKDAATSPAWNAANGNTNFSPGRGYLVAYEATNTTKNFNGALNSGSVSYPLTRGGTTTYQYYNLVGNPYPCAIDWEAIAGWDRSNLFGTQKSYWIWNDAVGNYGTYITSGSGTNGATRYIPGGQGFMVLAATVGNFTMGNGIKVNSSKAYFKNEEIISDELRLRLSCDVNDYSDEAIVALSHSDDDEGSEKFNSIYTNSPELCSVKNGHNYSINYMDDTKSEKLIPLIVKAGIAGNYTLTASQVESFGGNSVISLEDLVSGSFTNLGTSLEYTFLVSEPATIKDRFYLHFLDVTSVPDQEVDQRFGMYAFDGAITITSLQQQGGKITVFDILGRTIATGRVEAGTTSRIDMQGNTGIYIVSVQTSKGFSNIKMLVK